jgi:16S rRNA (uracil1498-N3)-methyltransferase
MHRFYCPDQLPQDRVLLLTSGEAHHGLHVLRIRPGERVLVVDGQGTESLAEVGKVDRDGIRLTVLERHSLPPQACQVTLIQALPKGKIIEWIIQKATELGVSRIVPLLTQRVVARLDPNESAQKARKWQTVAIESIKQCGSAWLPQVDVPITPGQFLARGERFDLAVVASLGSCSRHPRAFFDQFQAQYHRSPKSIAVWVGPEGDFTSEESAAIQSAGVVPITLGPLVLRSETAALYCLSILNYEVQARIQAFCHCLPPPDGVSCPQS